MDDMFEKIYWFVKEAPIFVGVCITLFIVYILKPYFNPPARLNLPVAVLKPGHSYESLMEARALVISPVDK